MFVYKSPDRDMRFGSARELKGFLCEEHTPMALSRAVAADMAARAYDMGRDDLWYLAETVARAMLGLTTMEDQLMGMIEYIGESGEEIELEGIGATIGYEED